jgi:dephospho-CoA kinase
MGRPYGRHAAGGAHNSPPRSVGLGPAAGGTTAMSRLGGVYLIGLTGGIASGKSTVARRLYEHGAVHIDADQLARRVVEPGRPALQAVVEAFGPDVLRADGTLDRPRLGEIVFHDDAARATLNGIVHPAVRELSKRLIADAEREDPDAVVVYDVPLLVEASVDVPFDLIVVTSAGRKQQVKRLVEERGMDPIHAEARVDSQVGDDERRKVADVVIDTSGSLGHTMSQTDALWARVAEEQRARRAGA